MVGPRNGFQLMGAQSAISAGGGCLNQAPSPWPQIGPKLMGAWHPLLKIDGCTGTRGTRSYEDPGKGDNFRPITKVAFFSPLQ